MATVEPDAGQGPSGSADTAPHVDVRAAHEDLLSALAKLAIESVDLVSFQQVMLEQLGRRLDVSRCYIFTYRADDDTVDNTAEWTAPGVSPQQQDLQDIPSEAAPWWTARMRRGEDIRFDDIDDISDQGTRDVLAPQGILSILAVPLHIGTRYYGFMGFDECRQHRHWHDEERALLSGAVRILMGVWADDDLRQSEGRFRSVLENVATVAVYGYAANGVVHYWNVAAETLFGYAAHEAVGRNLLDLIVSPEDRGRAESVWARVGRGETVPAGEVELRHRDGHVLPVLSSTVAARIPGRPIELFSLDVDLSRIRQAQRDLLATHAQLVQAQKMEAVGQLAAGIAHDFNNLLTLIIGNCETLLAREPGDEAVTEAMAAAHRAVDLTKQLLRFSRKELVRPRVLDLNQVLVEADSMLTRLLGERVRLMLSRAPSLWRVSADAGHLSQVIVNLAVNARDAMPDGGTLMVETSNVAVSADAPWAALEVPPGEYAVLSVTDSGIGIPEDALPRLFEPFFTTKGAGQGTGLGLSVVHGIVKQAGGTITVESLPGQGSTFRVFLPRVHEPLSPKAAPQATPAPEGRGEVILLVEDEYQVRRLLKRLLVAHGYTVLEAARGEEALTVHAEYDGQVALLITDVVMPDLGGRELADRVRAVSSDTPVLYISGYTDDAVMRHGILHDEIHFLQKPFTTASLLSTVRRVIDGRR